MWTANDSWAMKERLFRHNPMASRRERLCPSRRRSLVSCPRVSGLILWHFIHRRIWSRSSWFSSPTKTRFRSQKKSKHRQSSRRRRSKANLMAIKSNPNSRRRRPRKKRKILNALCGFHQCRNRRTFCPAGEDVYVTSPFIKTMIHLIAPWSATVASKTFFLSLNFSHFHFSRSFFNTKSFMVSNLFWYFKKDSLKSITIHQAFSIFCFSIRGNDGGKFQTRARGLILLERPKMVLRIRGHLISICVFFN